MHSSTWVLIVSLAPVLLGVGMVAGRGCAASRPTSDTREDYAIATPPAVAVGVDSAATPFDRAPRAVLTATGETTTTAADLSRNADPRTDPRASFTPAAPAGAPAGAPRAMSVEPSATAARTSTPEAPAPSASVLAPQAPPPAAPSAQALTAGADVASEAPPLWITSGAYVFGADPNQAADAGAGGGGGAADSGSLFDAAAGGILLDGATSARALLR